MILSDQRDSATQSRPFVGSTTYQKHFDMASRGSRVQNQVPISALKDAFHEIANEGSRPCVYVNQLNLLLTKALGVPPSEHELELYEKEFENSESGKFTYGELENAVIRIQVYLNENFRGESGLNAQPPWLMSSTKIKPKVLQGHSSLSSHHIDFGKYGQAPGQRPYIRKTGMASTTSDLMMGTSRDTHHIPGYCGFIPCAGNNPEAVQQGDCRNPRASHEDLRLYHSDDIPGYTGHKPVSCGNYRGQMSTGLDKKTTHGATYTSMKK